MKYIKVRDFYEIYKSTRKEMMQSADKSLEYLAILGNFADNTFCFAV